jgi:glycosyltransferase involved in cell wall biosynthesis
VKILWAKIGFLHPTTRGGDIRTLEMLKHLRARHEIHYATPNDLTHPEGLARCHEYCSKAHTVPFRPVAKPSPAFFAELVRGFFDPLPVGIFRWQIAPFGRLLAELLAREHFDRVVCDFLFPAINFPSLKGCVLFQHNVEAVIWQRLAANASSPLKRAYLSRQAERMFDYERRVCGEVDRVIAVSEVDARLMREMYGIRRVDAIPTGVDINYFAPPEIRTERKWDLIFVGSMDYLPNIEGVRYFVRDVLPRIRAARPGTTLAVAGRKPPEEITAMARDPGITVTGTVADIRPYLWGSAVSVVPLLTGGGTRLKIYESMAACRPVVSTTVGAEGLTVHPPHDIRIADTADRFAAECLAMLENDGERETVACAGRRLVAENFSWDQVSRRFEALLQ